MINQMIASYKIEENSVEMRWMNYMKLGSFRKNCRYTRKPTTLTF